LDAPQCPTDNVEAIQTSEQHRLVARSISIQQGVGFQKSTLFGKSLQTCRTMSSISEYSRVSFEHGKDFSEGRSVKLSGREPDKDRITLFLKDIAENRPDVANFRPDARQPESES
jgi:hypothetical protein